MKAIQIGSTEVILQNYEINQGKIIISDLYNGSYSYYWGSMGGTLEEFIKSTSPDYFAGKLCVDQYVFSGKSTAKAIRRYIKHNMTYDLPWYKYMPAQKELREAIKQIERCEDKHDALHQIERFKDIYTIGMSFQEDDDFKDIMESHFNCDPWHFLETEPSPSYKFLVKLHKQLKMKL
jgi:hypothetical protein